ncbi:MAG: hypothetical protein E5Y10_34970 [Mesorhizobium sp.]|uniref:hypothetical protein n=1 Tax=Mesorhizobium sp. TaxID=1871066 RepID=UPI00121817BC|nr:MAG: hypothetical protein E5Y13_34600 [Mesorhizobium sp.]TJU83567.1 MAG: hypothetical protein E5Y10_34970 [Mesorhizobium sp.]
MVRDVVEWKPVRRGPTTCGMPRKVVTRWVEPFRAAGRAGMVDLLEAEDEPRRGPRPRWRMRWRHFAGSA